MELLTIVILTLLLLAQIFTIFIIIGIEKWLSILCNIEPDPKPEEAKVTDPFTKPKPVHSSTQSIVVPKTPTEIRNENYKKIKEGMEYGDIARG